MEKQEVYEKRLFLSWLYAGMTVGRAEVMEYDGNVVERCLGLISV